MTENPILKSFVWEGSSSIPPNYIQALKSEGIDMVMVDLYISDSSIESLAKQYDGIVVLRGFHEGKLDLVHRLVSRYPNVKAVLSYETLRLACPNPNHPGIYVGKTGLPDGFFNTYRCTWRGVPKLNATSRCLTVCSHVPAQVLRNTVGPPTRGLPCIVLRKGQLDRHHGLNRCNVHVNLSFKRFYNAFQISRVFFYTERGSQRLHYSPIEAAIIGVPVVFYDSCVLWKGYFPNHPGACRDANDMHNKIRRILGGDTGLINSILRCQEANIHKFSTEFVISSWSKFQREVALWSET